MVLTDGRYPLAAYAFLRDGLERADRDASGPRQPDQLRHVTGEQCCLALRDLAIERWGKLARTVLARWNIHATIDFGNMVYLLIENKLMFKTPQDSVADFRDVYDFEEAFSGGEEFQLTE